MNNSNFQGLYPREKHTNCITETWNKMFIEALFIKTKNENNPKIQYIKLTVVYSHNQILYCHKKNELLFLHATRTDFLKVMWRSERN